MIKINNRNEGMLWINHRHIVSFGKSQVHPDLFVTRIRMSDGSIFHALEDVSVILTRIAEAKRMEREVE
jgi:hypothetical protein